MSSVKCLIIYSVNAAAIIKKIKYMYLERPAVKYNDRILGAQAPPSAASETTAIMMLSAIHISSLENELDPLNYLFS